MGSASAQVNAVEDKFLDRREVVVAPARYAVELTSSVRTRYPKRA
jgi:hypothetical protein